MLADRDREIPAIPAGYIGAIVGLKHAQTGDTLVLSSDKDPCILRGIALPSPVFTAALEVDTPTELRQLQEALDILLRQDPSLRLEENEDTGQLLLSGMGELHLEVSAERLRREHGLEELRLGRMRVAFRERLLRDVVGTADVDLSRSAGAAAGARRGDGDSGSSSSRWGRMAVRLLPLPEDHPADMQASVQLLGLDKDGLQLEQFKVSVAQGASGDGSSRDVPRRTLDAVQTVLLQAAGRGPLCGAPILGLQAEILPEECILSDPSDAVVARAATALAIRNGLEASGTALMEPWMKLEAVVPDGSVGSVLSDLSANRTAKIGTVGPVDGQPGRSSVQAKVPLRSMVGYSTYLRSTTAGDGTFTMELDRYDDVSPEAVSAALSDRY